MLLVRALILLVAATSLTHCANLHEEPSKVQEVDVEAEADFKPATFVAAQGITPKTPGTSPTEWMTCKGPKSLGTFLLMHSDASGFDPKRFCRGWFAQAFLSQGYDVVTVNRPGYGASVGRADYSGKASMDAVKSAVTAAAAQLPTPVIGIWGYGSGATAAALASKHLQGLKFLVVGGGFYDLEDSLRHTTDARAKADLEAIQKTGGSKAMEERSVGYDTSGLPPTIITYHGDSDAVAPLGQARTFTDSLTSSGQYKVTAQVLDKTGHEIPWVYHRHLLESLIASLATVNASGT